MIITVSVNAPRRNMFKLFSCTVGLIIYTENIVDVKRKSEWHEWKCRPVSNHCDYGSGFHLKIGTRGWSPQNECVNYFIPLCMTWVRMIEPIPSFIHIAFLYRLCIVNSHSPVCITEVIRLSSFAVRIYIRWSNVYWACQWLRPLPNRVYTWFCADLRQFPHNGLYQPGD